MRPFMRPWFIAIFLTYLPSAVLAQSTAPQKDLYLSAGAAMLVRSTYEGSDETKVTPIPYIEMEYKQKYFINGGQGVGLYLYRDGQKRLSTSIGFGFGREESEDARLAGLGDIDRGAAMRVDGRWPLGKYLAGTAALKHQITGSDTGTTLDVGVGTRLLLSSKLSIYPGLSVTFSDDDHARTVFGLTEAQITGSINAGGSFTDTYTPDAGLKSMGVSALLRYDLTDRWEATGIVSWAQYQGDIADSPIIQSDSNLFSLWAVGYKF